MLAIICEWCTTCTITCFAPNAGQAVLNAFVPELEAMYARGIMPPPQQQQMRPTAAAPSPPPPSTSEDAHAPGGMTNEQLAHELLLDPGFTVDEKDDNDTS